MTTEELTTEEARGLAQRWAVRQRAAALLLKVAEVQVAAAESFERGDFMAGAAQTAVSAQGFATGAKVLTEIGPLDTERLFGWVRRRMASIIAGPPGPTASVGTLLREAIADTIADDLDITAEQARTLCESAGWPS